MNQNDEKRAREPVPIKNRDIILLSRVLYTMQDVSATEVKRMWQQDRLWNITQKITGLPGGNGLPKGLDANFAAIGEIEEKYAEECKEYVKELQEAENILNGIPSRTMRTFVTMKYLLDMPDKKIMAELNIKRWRLESMKKSIEQAPNMASVKWQERYMLQDDSTNSN